MEREAIFVWLPKCAGTSINNVLAKNGGVKQTNSPLERFSNTGIITFGHVSIPCLLEKGIIEPGYFKRAFKFAFVRNPFDRLVSLFHYKKRFKDSGIPAAMTFWEFCHVIEQGDYPPVGLYNVSGLSQCNPMLDWLKDEKGRIFLDFVGRYENLKPDFLKVCGILGINEQLPHENRSEHRHYREHYTPETRGIVEKVYREDLEYFGYGF